MKRWRLLTVSSSALLTLLLVAFALGWAGYSYLNQQLKSFGVTDWSIAFERVTISHIIVKRLEVTIDSLPARPGKEPATNLNLTKIFSFEISPLLPERIDIKSLQLKGTLLPDKVSATIKLLNQKQLSLKINSHQPITANLEIIRDDAAIKLKAHYDSNVLDANYNYRSGQLKADASYLLPAQHFADNVSTKPLPVKAQWRGNLSTNINSVSFESISSAISGQLLLSVEKNAEIEIDDSSTMAKGQLKLDLNNGIINSYRLELEGDTKNLISLTESELPVQLTSLSWQLNSTEQPELSLLNAQQAVNDIYWPIRLDIAAKGSKNENISISSRFSGKFSASSAELQSITPAHIELNLLNNTATAVIDSFNVNYPYSEPHNVFAEFGLNIHTNSINYEPLPRIKAAFNSQFRYQQQELVGDGMLLLGDHISVQHHTQINASRIKSKG
ncbi:hypothetical protein [Idiomarina aminovorans]|uniref:hypothetical protein n=1 Tax=Idiomarina aminovorans TaxID=2914829 RepID=UPI002005539A|nr:hypothetical protein [Idiomarina sp. ATCH4]MCK7458629.1 hypothetical protein [Idiomarina sp. ATCH4]